eukprot:12891874-Prorocentrum_lima.AAC.1
MGSPLGRRYPHVCSWEWWWKEKLVMHPRPYLEHKSKKRGLLAPNFGKESLPAPQEGHYLQEDKGTP